MPRLKKYSERYATEDFQKCMRAEMGALEMQWKELAESMGISRTTLRNRAKQPEQFTVANLRVLLRVLGLPEEAILLLIRG